MPKPFDFGAEPDPAPTPASASVAPRAFDFDDLPLAPPAPEPGVTSVARALFESEDHPAVRDALAIARIDYPVLCAHAEGRMAALFRRILPVRLSLVMQWAQAPLMEQARLLQPVTELVLQFADMAVPALLEDALESTKSPAGVFGKLFRRPTPPALYKPALASSRAQLLQLMDDSEIAMRGLEASAQTLNLHLATLVVVSKLAGGALDATLADALVQRRTLLQQAVRQAELSMLQMAQVRQQAAELIGQVTSFLTVTLPALEMAQAQTQGGN